MKIRCGMLRDAAAAAAVVRLVMSLLPLVWPQVWPHVEKPWCGGASTSFVDQGDLLRHQYVHQ